MYLWLLCHWNATPPQAIAKAKGRTASQALGRLGHPYNLQCPFEGGFI